MTALVVTLGVALPGPGPGGLADDTDLFTVRVPPNVMFIADNSGSMNSPVWHPRFHPDAVYDPINCPYVADVNDPAYNVLCLEYPLCNIAYEEPGFDGGPDDRWSDGSGETFRTDHGRVGIDKCGNVRDVWVDPLVEAENNEMRWYLPYLRWYFSDNVESDPENDGSTILDEILDLNNGVTSQCVLAEDPSQPATFPKYKRARITALKGILRSVICDTSKVADIRYGLAKFYTSSDPQGGYVRVPIDDYTTTHASDLAAKIDELEGDVWTPLGETLYNVYRYFQSRDTNKQALGKNTTTRFPVYDLNVSGGTTGTIPPSPVTDDCQLNFVVIISDGEPLKDDFDNMDFDRFNDELIGDYNLPGDEDETPPNTVFAPVLNAGSCSGNCEIARYLDDIAKYMQDTDFQLDDAFPGKQVIDTYTVGFATSTHANAVLLKTAQAGNGKFFTSNSPEQLAAGLTAVITDIVNKAQSFTSAAVPASRTTDGNNFYSSYFQPVEDSPFWEGHLKNFDFSVGGEILTPAGKCAIGSDPNAAPPCLANGGLRTAAPGFWDVADHVPTPANRNLYLELGDKAMFSMPDAFEMPPTPSDAVTAFGIVAGVDDLDEPFASLSPNADTDMAQAVIDTLRGCEFGSSPCVERFSTMGDFFHSNPAVVGSPNSAINEGSYKTFANTYRFRTRVIYAGTNDGWLHGFNAGIWRTLESDGVTPLVPPRHDRGTGEELFGFMPWEIRTKVKDLLKQQSGLRSMVTVDGSPVVADVWFNRAVSGGALGSVDPTAGIATAKDPAQWRTVLMGGLREGGMSYYALDITDPTELASDTTTTYPRYLWGFPCDDCANAENPGSAAEATYLGYTWSEPVITRVRVKPDSTTDVNLYERWVAIFGGGYHGDGDPNGSDYKQPGDTGFVPKGRAIYMVDITTGEVLAKKHFDENASALSTTPTVGVKEMRYAIPSAPAVFDVDFDGFADIVFIGDLGGNMWKWVISDAGDDPINNATHNKSLAQPNWPFRLWFRAGTSQEPTLAPEVYGNAFDTSLHYQSFFFPPTGTLRGSKLLLAFGAGERANPIGPAGSFTDADLTNNNHYYVVKDADPFENIGTAPDFFWGSLDEGDLADFDANTPLTCAVMKATKQGYYITGRDAEKFISNSVIFFGTVFTGSFLPNDPATTSPCDGSGTAFLYAFDLECGVGLYSTNPGTVQDKRRKAIGGGIPTKPRVSVGGLNNGGGGGGCDSKIVVVTSDGNIDNDCPGPLPGGGIQVKSWREQ